MPADSAASAGPVHRLMDVGKSLTTRAELYPHWHWRLFPDRIIQEALAKPAA